MNTFFSDKIFLWRKMAKIWLKIWLKVIENGTKKIKLAKMVAKEKKILVRTPFIIKLFWIKKKCLFLRNMEPLNFASIFYFPLDLSKNC